MTARHAAHPLIFGNDFRNSAFRHKRSGGGSSDRTWNGRFQSPSADSHLSNPCLSSWPSPKMKRAPHQRPDQGRPRCPAPRQPRLSAWLPSWAARHPAPRSRRRARRVGSYPFGGGGLLERLRRVHSTPEPLGQRLGKTHEGIYPCKSVRK